MPLFDGEVGLQFTTHLASRYTVPEWVELAALAHEYKFNQIWVNDNLGYRNLFVILAAIASKVPVRIGTAILVPYFRNPVDTADALASLSELVNGSEISVGIARGDFAQAGNQVNAVKPLSMVRETVDCIKRLLAGQTVPYAEYPTLCSFFGFKESSTIHLRFSPRSPIRFYSGGNGPKIMRIAGQMMDGILIGGFYIALVRSGKLKPLLDAAELGRRESQNDRRLKKVCEINISVSDDYEQARTYPKRFIAHMVPVLDALGFSEEEFSALGFDPPDVHRIKYAFERGETIEKVAAELITDRMVDAGFIAGRPKDCIEKLEEMCTHAKAYGFDQIALAKLGPNYDEAIRSLARDVLPAVVGG